MKILGISAFYHDAAAALVSDGVPVAAVQEERYTRLKHDPAFPVHAIRTCLEMGDVGPNELDAVVYYEKPLTKFVRILRTHFRVGPAGFHSFREAMPQWMRQKLWVSYEIERGLRDLGWKMPKDLWFTEHHQAHAASAFFPSPFESAAILTFDGVGEWATSSIGLGKGGSIELLNQLDFPDSLGLLYSAFTYHCGFRVNSGEYKLMGLAPYGEPKYADEILDKLVDLRSDGSFSLDQKYFSYLAGRKMTSKRFDALFGGPPRQPETPITQREMDMAASIQQVTEEIVLAMAETAAKKTGEKRAVLSGGVALNCVANGRLLREGPFDEIWVQPAAGDAGSALGAALYGWYQIAGNDRTVVDGRDAMAGSYLGPSWTSEQIREILDERGYPYERVPGDERAGRIAQLLADGKVVGLFQGRMEFGPRALGHRSILADPRDPETQSRLNLKTKFRESFRPFAPAVLAEKANDWFDLDGESPYMLLTATVSEPHRVDPGPHTDDLREWVAQARSDIPAVTHVDHSARVQTVAADRSPLFHAVLQAFDELTGCPVLVNTSFNVRGEPIVCTPEDAYRCFLRTDIDVLVLEDCLLERADQPELPSHELEIDLVLD